MLFFHFQLTILNNLSYFSSTEYDEYMKTNILITNRIIDLQLLQYLFRSEIILICFHWKYFGIFCLFPLVLLAQSRHAKMVLDQFLKCWNGLGVYKWIYTRVCTKQYVKTSSNDCFLIRRKRNIDNAINNFLSEI